jgi:AAA family ATP:ADP antiporter
MTSQTDTSPRPAVALAWLTRIVDARPYEIRAVVLAFTCNFVLMGSYYLLRPVRDAMATVFGVNQLPGTAAVSLRRLVAT